MRTNGLEFKEVESLLRLGGVEVSVDTSHFSASELVGLAKATKSKHARLRITAARYLSVREQLTIKRIGRGKVYFEE